MGRRMPRPAALLSLLALSLAPTAARAFSFESAFSDGCHERITRAAVRRVGWPGGAQPPALSAENALRLSRDLPFALTADDHNPWTLALVLGARDNDLHGYAASDFQELAVVHSAAEDQREHCLRSPTDDGPEGDVTALASCRGFILSELSLAIGDGADVDLAATESVPLSLPFSGRRDAAVQRYGWHLGRALHALQDSFTHTFRSPDGRRVRHVLNFVDPARGGDYSEARDGHDHVNSLDGCDPESARETHRADLATTASEQLLGAVVDATGGSPGRLARATAVLDAWLTVEPGCVYDNRWCNAPEADEDNAAGCSASPSARTSTVSLVAALAVAALLLRRRRYVAAVVLAASLSLLPRSARAQSPYEPGRFAVRALAGASLDRGAMAVSVGAHWRASSRFSLGITTEYNPWYSLPTARLFAGVFNAYATAQFAWRRVGNLVLHSSVDVGTSVLLDGLIGAEGGTVGLYAGANILGVTVDLGPHLRLVVLPASVGIPIPQMARVPIVYQQYRFSIGVEWEF